MIFTDCGSKKPVTAKEKSENVKNKLDKKKKRAYERARKKAIKAHYDRQGPKTKERMDKRAAESEAWRDRHSQSPGLWIRIKDWFKKIFKKLNRPEKGLDDNVTP